MDESRIIELEIKISHQEAAIEALQQLVYDQHKVIEKLEGQIKRLANRIDGVNDGPEIGPANEKPPHY